MPRTSRPVKPSAASGGQARTRLARRAVVAAAGELFLERGYATTTVDAISTHADVPVATVYRLFGSKPGILKALLDTSIGGDDAPVAVSDRPQVTSLRDELDPRRVVAGFVAVAVAINERSTAIYGMLTGAALTDPAAADLLAEITAQRATGQRRLTKKLAELDELRDGLTEPRAADIVYAIMSPETYRLLVIDRRWAVRRYRDWLDETLRHQLLRLP